MIRTTQKKNTKQIAMPSITFDKNCVGLLSFRSASTALLAFKCVNKSKSFAPRTSPPNPYPRPRPIIAQNNINSSKFAVFQTFRMIKITSSKTPRPPARTLATRVANLSVLRKFETSRFTPILKDTSPKSVSVRLQSASARVSCRSKWRLSERRGTASSVRLECVEWQPRQSFWPCRRCDEGYG
jgi:hypothetical protein